MGRKNLKQFRSIFGFTLQATKTKSKSNTPQIQDPNPNGYSPKLEAAIPNSNPKFWPDVAACGK